MKYSEFKTIAKKHGWEIDNSYNYWLYANKLLTRISIDKTGTKVLNITTDDAYYSLFEEKEFIKAYYELAETPIEDREDEKEYYLRHMFLGVKFGENYLNMDITSGLPFLADRLSVNEYKTSFTIRELEEIENEGFDLRNFEKVEVKGEF